MQYEYFAANDGTRLAYQTSVPLSADSRIGGTVSTTAAMTETTTIHEAQEYDDDDDSEATSAPEQQHHHHHRHHQSMPQRPKTCILLLHGFSGSSEYFTRHNTAALAKEHWVLAPDMRGHGRSERTQGGYHVARLAQDLHDLIHGVVVQPSSVPSSLASSSPSLSKPRIYAIGCSIGAAVLWTYTELFTDRDFAGFIFVDQAPLQNRSVFDAWGEGLAHYGCYDEATTLAAQRAWASPDPVVREETYAGLVASCLGYRFAPSSSDDDDGDDNGDGDEEGVKSREWKRRRREEDEKFFMGISRKCDGRWLARLLADHTRYDHREAIEGIARPVLVLAGRRSGCFSLEGMGEIVRRARKGRDEARKMAGGDGGETEVEPDMIVFESGHWLFWEEPERFNREVLGFVAKCEGLTR